MLLNVKAASPLYVDKIKALVRFFILYALRRMQQFINNNALYQTFFYKPCQTVKFY